MTDIRSSVVLGTGSVLPARTMSNRDFEGVVETSDEWIRQRTGIAERHIADKDETTVSLGEAAARKALDAAGIDAQSIDLIISCFGRSDPESARHSPWLRLRHAGGLQRLRLCDDDG